MKRLLIIAVLTTVTALLLGWLLQRPQPDAHEKTAERTLPEFRVEAELSGEGLRPYKVRVPKDHQVHLLIRVAPDAASGMLALSGYEDRVPALGVGPGLAREFVFISDRPGDDFGFVLGEEIVGRLEVTGSHLESGHR